MRQAQIGQVFTVEFIDCHSIIDCGPLMFKHVGDVNRRQRAEVRAGALLGGMVQMASTTGTGKSHKPSR